MPSGDWKDMLKAVENGDFELVKYHLNNGIDINYEHPEVVTTVLIESAKLGNAEMVRFLIEHGADPFMKAGFGGNNAIEIAHNNKDATLVALLNEMGFSLKKESFFDKIGRWLSQFISA
ncbi:MAG: ankyrin repeat domain-containing protein [Saprospiraceae bacterium]|nr:ankyrin repeat domain-containing protein [Saprospiraceae bacterium]